MSEIGSGSGTSYPTTLDTDNTQEVNSPNVGKTRARAEVVNDLASAIVALETELGTSAKGTTTNVKTFLQLEHNLDGTHKTINTATNASGSGTALYAAETGLKVIRGNGYGATVLNGTGFTLAYDAGTGLHTINFTSAFSGVPSVSILPYAWPAFMPGVFIPDDPTVSSIQFYIADIATGVDENTKFTFIAIGPK